MPSGTLYRTDVKLSKYQTQLYKNCTNKDKIINHISDIKKQRITQIMYLPATNNMEESLVFLDKISNIDNKYIDRTNLKNLRIFSFSDYGFYLFVFKLSVHFSRIQEKVNRGMGI